MDANICSEMPRVPRYTDPGPREPRPERRKVERPPYEQLLADVRATSFVAVGRKYGVSDKAVRKWIRWYEYQREMAEWKEREEHRRRVA